MGVRVTETTEWVDEFMARIAPYERRIVQHQYFQEMASGALSMKRFHGGLINFYPLIKSFPTYMALTLSKLSSADTAFGMKTRQWLLGNIRVERRHAEWWKDWAAGFGVPRDLLEGEICPPPEMDAINNFLWRTCTRGSFVEAISAANFAIEGPTGQWTKYVQEGMTKYKTVKGVKVNDKTMKWIRTHANYDDQHPQEAFDIIKCSIDTADDRKKAEKAVIRSMEYYALALDACYELFR